MDCCCGSEDEYQPDPFASSGDCCEGVATTPQHTVRIFPLADENLCLSIRYGDVVLAPANPHDDYQHWIKDFRFSNEVVDEEGFPGFALINKSTGQAIKHSVGATHRVRLITYNPDYLDESILWTESSDTGEGFRCIRMVNNIDLNFDAYHGDEDHGGVHDGTTIVLWKWMEGRNQRWKIEPWDVYCPPVINHASRERTVRVFTRAQEDYSLTIRDGEVVLAPANPCDDYQHWIKDMRHSTEVKDEEGLPGFALVNKATGEAIKHSFGATHPVRLFPYDPDYLDESVLWTESKDTGGGFRAIRMVNNINLNFDALHGDEDHGGVQDGTTVVLWEWVKGINQRWKIIPYCKFIRCPLGCSTFCFKYCKSHTLNL